jgi:uncharacterized damage-inducible protein DinB
VHCTLIRVCGRAVHLETRVWPKLNWTDRQFAFDFPTGLAPEILERLRGTPARVQERVTRMAPSILTARASGGWSIQEHVGHLADLEPLFMGRLDDFAAGLSVLRAADMTNRKTWEARHNDRLLKSVIEDLRTMRRQLIERLENLPFGAYDQHALHPRLNTQMRLVDLLYFQAEHDDYHLARISDLLGRGNTAASSQ